MTDAPFDLENVPMIGAEIDGRGAAVETCSTGCRRHAARGQLLALVWWLGAAVAALSVAAVPFDFGEALCGVWGCLPPLSALVAMHLFWFVAFGAGVHAATATRPPLTRPLGVVLVLAALAGAVIVLGVDLSRWLEQVPDRYQSFWPRRLAYTLGTKTDLPLVQALAAGVACLVLAKRSTRSKLEPSC